MALWLKNACFIDPETLSFTRAHIQVETGSDGNIFFHDVAKTPAWQVEKDEIIDCAGKYVMKSFAVGHHHAYSALATGMPPPENPPRNFAQILSSVWWKLDKALDRDMIKASALVTAMACAKSGSTFVIDHHASPNAIRGSLELISEALESVGLDHLLCYEISDRDGPEKAQAGLDETREYLARRQGLVGLHASFTVGPETLEKAVSLMQETDSGIHIHVAEDVLDQEHCQQNYGMHVVERLAGAGALESAKTLLVHCLHLDDKERDILRTAPAFVVENMESNLNNRVGHFKGQGLSDRILLGTDGMHSDMIRSAQAAYFAGLEHDHIDVPTTYQRFRKVHEYLAQNAFSGDGENNLVVLDYNPPTGFSENNFHGHFIYGLRSGHIRDVISNGRVIVRDRILQKIDEAETLAYAREQTKRLWKKL